MNLIPPTNPTQAQAERQGFRFGDKGTHTSRTIMLDELTSVLGVTPPQASRPDYAAAIIDDNALGKQTLATRRLSNQRLGELYGLDFSVGVFRVMRRLWDSDPRSRPLLAVLCALARDPLLAGTAPAVTDLRDGEEFPRVLARQTLRTAVGPRLNDSILDKVLRNAASSWAQARLLEGRTFKRRCRVTPTASTVAYALYLAYAVGFRGDDLFSNGWMDVLDAQPADARRLAMEAKRLGLIDINISDGIVDLKLDRLDPLPSGR